MSSSKIFLGINVTLFLKNKRIFQENLYCSLTWSANISLKFTLQTQKKYENIKTQTCLHEIFFFQSSFRKHIPPKCLTTKIQTLEK